jgi:hypothetical protein
MFTPLWNKYLPIIRILMKRSVNGNQTLDMNRTDFERASGGRKAKLTFSMSLHKGRIQNVSNPPPVAKELAAIFLEDDVTRQLVRQQDFEVSMNTSYQLTIKNISALAEAEKAGDTSAESETDEKIKDPKEKDNIASV